MKVALAVIVAFVFLLLGWGFLTASLYGIEYVASRAREGLGLMHLLNRFLIWFLAPGFGGFLATYITPQIFKDIDVATITTSFISVVVTIAIIFGLFSLLFVRQDISIFIYYISFLIQVVAILVGAKIGKRLVIESNA